MTVRRIPELATVTRPGLSPTLPNDSSKFLNGLGIYSVPITNSLLYSNTSVPASNTIANTASETAFNSSYNILANTLSVGDILRITASGVYGTALVAPTLRGRLKLGSTTVLDTTAITTVAGITNGGWIAYGYLVITAVGAGGTVEAQGYTSFESAATSALAVQLKNTAALSVAFNSDKAITITIQWGTADASNTITLRQLIIEKLSVNTGIPTVFSGARAYNSAAQSITDITDVAITFDTEVYDTDGYHSTSSNTSRFTAPRTGKYLVIGQIVWATNATGIRRAFLRLNGATDIQNNTVNATGSSFATQMQVSTIINLNAGDYIELVGRQSSGGNLNTNAGNLKEPAFMITYLGA